LDKPGVHKDASAWHLFCSCSLFFQILFPPLGLLSLGLEEFRIAYRLLPGLVPIGGVLLHPVESLASRVQDLIQKLVSLIPRTGHFQGSLTPALAKLVTETGHTKMPGCAISIGRLMIHLHFPCQALLVSVLGGLKVLGLCFHQPGGWVRLWQGSGLDGFRPYHPNWLVGIIFKW
jgi:hypothetical protein